MLSSDCCTFPRWKTAFPTVIGLQFHAPSEVASLVSMFD